MDLCTLEDAFPNIESGSPHNNWKPGSGPPFVGGKDNYSSREERKAARKRAKKLKGPVLAFSDSVVPDLPTDPDRPAVERMEPVDAMKNEGFELPVLPKASCLFSETGTPKYFGKWMEDDVEEPYTSFTPSIKDDANYRLEPDFTKSGSLSGIEKIASVPLPEPPLNDSWKPISPAASYTAYFKDIPPKKRSTVVADPTPEDENSGSKKDPVGINDTSLGNGNDALQRRINELIGRIDQLEKKNALDSQNEILMFVGTGLFLLVSFELFTRR